MIIYGNKKLLRNIILIILAIGCLGIYNRFSDLPYCQLEHQYPGMVRGQKPFYKYFFSKMMAQRVELLGEQEYGLYLYVADSDGIQSLEVTMDNMPVYVEYQPYTKKIATDLKGNTAYGIHKFVAKAIDRKGNVSTSIAYIKIKPIGGGVGGGIVY